MSLKALGLVTSNRQDSLLSQMQVKDVQQPSRCQAAAAGTSAAPDGFAESLQKADRLNKNWPILPPLSLSLVAVTTEKVNDLPRLFPNKMTR